MKNAILLAKTILKASKLREQSFSHKKALKLRQECKYPDYNTCYKLSESDAIYIACIIVYGNTLMSTPIYLMLSWHNDAIEWSKDIVSQKQLGYSIRDRYAKINLLMK